MKTVKGLLGELHMLTERTEVYRRTVDVDYEANRVAAAPYMLSIDDGQGNRQGHHHDTSGHDFPMTRVELERLRAQITALLTEG